MLKQRVVTHTANHVGLFVMLHIIKHIQRKVGKPVKNMIRPIGIKEEFMKKNIKNLNQIKSESGGEGKIESVKH